jgi:nitroreductase
MAGATATRVPLIASSRLPRIFRKSFNRIIEAGRFAPSAGNNQPWKFVIIQDQKVLSQLNRASKKTLRFFSRLCLPETWIDKYTPGDKKAKLKKWQKLLLWILVWFVGGDADQRAHGGLNAVTSDPEFSVFFNAPTMIIFLADKRAIGGTELDTGICAQNMVLTAHSLGLGTCYVDLITKALVYNKKFRRRLGIADPFEIVTSLAVGYPQGKIDGIVRREKARVTWIK